MFKPKRKPISHQKRTGLERVARNENNSDEKRRAALEELGKTDPDRALAIAREIYIEIPGRREEYRQRNREALIALIDSKDESFERFKEMGESLGFPKGQVCYEFFC